MSYNGYRKGQWVSSALIAVLVLLLVGGVAFYFAREHLGGRTKEKAEEKAVPAVIEVEKTITGEALQAKLRAAGVLVTQEYASTEVGSYESRNAAELFGQGVTVPLNRASFLYCYEGVTRAGVDLTELTLEKDDEFKTITVRLPKARILGTELKADSFRYYDEKTGTFSPIAVASPDAVNPILKENAEKRAADNGLLTYADESAKTQIAALLEGMFGTDGYAVSVETAA